MSRLILPWGWPLIPSYWEDDTGALAGLAGRPHGGTACADHASKVPVEKKTRHCFVSGIDMGEKGETTD